MNWWWVRLKKIIKVSFYKLLKNSLLLNFLLTEENASQKFSQCRDGSLAKKVNIWPLSVSAPEGDQVSGEHQNRSLSKLRLQTLHITPECDEDLAVCIKFFHFEDFEMRIFYAYGHMCSNMFTDEQMWYWKVAFAMHEFYKRQHNFQQLLTNLVSHWNATDRKVWGYTGCLSKIISVNISYTCRLPIRRINGLRWKTCCTEDSSAHLRNYHHSLWWLHI